MISCRIINLAKLVQEREGETQRKRKYREEGRGKLGRERGREGRGERA